MSGFHFATCNRRSALGFIQKVFPDKAIEDEGVVAELLDLVQRDEVRVQDPMMHGNRIAALPGTKATPESNAKAADIGKRLLEHLEAV